MHLKILALTAGHLPFLFQNKELLEKLAETEILLDKTSREKMSLQAELEIVRGQLSTNDLDYGKVGDKSPATLLSL